MVSKAPRKGKIVVLGMLFWYPLAGVTYQFLHYLIGLRRLGFDPHYVEASDSWVYDPGLDDLTPDAAPNIRAIVPVLESHGFSGRWSFPGNYPGARSYGIPLEDLKALYREAVAILNVTGQNLREEHSACPCRVYVETDPVASQVEVARGDERCISALTAYHFHFTFGENLGAPDCRVPVGTFAWLPTRQPVILDFWKNSSGLAGQSYTTIANWKNGDSKNIFYQGETYYWSKDREFKKIIDLPLRRKVNFELAVPVDGTVQSFLTRNGWRVAPSIEVSREVNRYRSYIQQSRGEFTVAKDQNVRLRSGWFSDRSACYLAAGRPVITQETGFSNVLPTGRGLFGWKTLDDIVAAVDAIETDYEGNCRAARDIAEEYFAAEKVIGSLLERANL